MSLTQTYVVAHTARGKLSKEASRGDHDLRLLVGHANLLDVLTAELQSAERDQEAWFDRTVKVSRAPDEPKRVQWSDSLPEEIQDEDLDIPDGSDDEDDDTASTVSSDEDMANEEADEEPSHIKVAPRRPKSPTPVINYQPTFEDDDDEVEDEDFVYDEDEDNHELALTRTASHSASPPELIHDSDSEEEDMGPSSPPEPSAATFARQGIRATDFATMQKPQQTHSSPPTILGGDLAAAPHYHAHAPAIAAF